jgi:lipid-binding SYLF domain-containing protein
MKKLLPFFLASCLCATGARASHNRADLVSEVNSCYAILQDFMRDPATAIPPVVWQQARAVLIVNQFKGGFILGVKGGYGVVMVKKSSGRWSVPVLVSANEESLGLQLGAKAVESVYVMTDDQTARLLFKQRFNIGVDAKAVAGPHAADSEAYNKQILSGPVLVYTKESGLFAGATVKTGHVARDDEANFVLYSTDQRMPELLYSDWVQPPPEVQDLMNFVQRISP